MPTDIIMPQMGESIVEGTITKWLKKPGDKVQRDEPLFEISTDKVDAEIPAPASGVLQEIKVTEGTTVGVNTVVGTIAVDGEAAAAPAKASAASRRRKAAKNRSRRKTAETKKPEEKKAAPSAPQPAPRARCSQTKRKKKLAPRRWSARSHANTESVFPKFPAPDSVAASPSKTSCQFIESQASQPAPVGTDALVRPAAPASARSSRSMQRPRHAHPLPRPIPATSSP